MPFLPRLSACVKRIRTASATQAAVLLAALPQLSFAALPQAQAPTRGEGTSIMQTIQNYMFDGFTLIGLVMCAAALIIVGRHAIGVYHSIHDGKAKWADLGATATVGVCLIGITIFLVTKATSVL